MKPLHVVTGSEGPPSPESSSFYSPGGNPDANGLLLNRPFSQTAFFTLAFFSNGLLFNWRCPKTAFCSLGFLHNQSFI
jgi:hypothetical protein